MLSLKMFFVLLGLSVLYENVHGKDIAIQTEKGVQLNGKGTVNVKISNLLSFTLPKSCQETFQLCYMAKENHSQYVQNAKKISTLTTTFAGHHLKMLIQSALLAVA
uniref:Secreted protein n=1 Tax=Panagrellus redivivus TaxID=6233 RepID=A0A7E4W3F6_PANRE